MDYSPTQEQEMVRRTASEFVDEFDRSYFEKHIENKTFPEEYWDELAETGLIGTMVPEEYGGAGMGMQEMAIAMEELSRGGDPGALALALTAIFGSVGIAKHGTEEQKEKYLPAIAEGDVQFCMALTEANAGINTLQIDTFAERDGDDFVVNGQKMWISGADHADGMLLIARTSEFDPSNPTHGFTLFLVDEPSERDEIELTPLDVHVPWYETQYQVEIDDLRLTEDDVLGGPSTVDSALYLLWDTLNTERIVTAAGAVGGGLRAVDLAVEYANDREVFGAPISSHQAIQHPLADAYSELITAREMMYKAAWKYDNDESCGMEANVAKLRSTEAATEAASHAIQTHGGNGFSADYEVFHLWVNSRLIETVPIPNEMVRNFLAEHTLGMPRSY
ncbi:MAG: acyl-CoA dehydrogenase family protein [Halobacteria archaeon]|nr:acyl-CoA dehydrogenase family protein [Halobacteria archaeon]